MSLSSVISQDIHFTLEFYLSGGTNPLFTGVLISDGTNSFQREVAASTNANAPSFVSGSIMCSAGSTITVVFVESGAQSITSTWTVVAGWMEN